MCIYIYITYTYIYIYDMYIIYVYYRISYSTIHRYRSQSFIPSSRMEPPIRPRLVTTQSGTKVTKSIKMVRDKYFLKINQGPAKICPDFQQAATLKPYRKRESKRHIQRHVDQCRWPELTLTLPFLSLGLITVTPFCK